MCLKYPGIKLFLGRNELKRIKISTFITFKKVALYHGIPQSLWKLNSQDNYIELFNGSRIDLLDVKYQPSDPLYERFGSSEYTAGWLEEVGEIHAKAFDVLKSRIGRHMNKEEGIMSKMLLTCNPKKNWVYIQFYKKWKEGTLAANKCFIQSLHNDNPHLSEDYKNDLNEIDDEVMKQRLKDGVWEYDEDASLIMKFEDIVKIFERDWKDVDHDELYVTVDPARFGKDKAMFFLWQGLFIKHIWWYPISKTTHIEAKIHRVHKKMHIPYSHIAVDEGGLGGGIVDHCPGVIGFVDGASPVEEFLEEMQETRMYNYGNLRAQTFFKLAEYIRDGKIGCYDGIPSDAKKEFTEELEVIRRKDAENNEKKVYIVPKEDLKETLGRSPDFADAAKMRMIFELGKSDKFKVGSEFSGDEREEQKKRTGDDQGMHDYPEHEDEDYDEDDESW